MNKLDLFEDGIILSGIGVSLADIQNILSIVLLSINLIWLSIKFWCKLFKYLKDGKLTDEEIKDIENELDKMDEITKGKDENKNE